MDDDAAERHLHGSLQEACGTPRRLAGPLLRRSHAVHVAASIWMLSVLHMPLVSVTLLLPPCSCSTAWNVDVLTLAGQVYDAASDPDGDPDVDPFDEKDRAGLAVERYMLRKTRR